MEPFDDKHKFYAFLAAAFTGLVLIAVLARGAFNSIALACALAYLFNPAVNWLEKRKVSRTVSILLILFLVLSVLVLVLSYLIPYLWNEGVQFIREAPDLAEKALTKIASWRLLPEEMTRSVPVLLNEIKGRILAGGWSSIKPLITGLFQATTGIAGGILALVGLVIIPVFFFFILKDLDYIRDTFYSFVPDPITPWVKDYLGMIDGVLSGFIRGQIIVALCLSVLYALGLGLTGIRFGVLIGVVAGLLFIIPYIGTFIGILASAMVLLVDFSGWAQVAGVVATFAVAQSIEGYILTPRIVGNRVGLNQLETLVVILVGGEMGGLPGLIMAIPAGGIFKKTIQFLMPDHEMGPGGETDERLYMADMVAGETTGSAETEGDTEEKT
ncbi:MAG: AI-2E family transporter [Pseudomonadota bacterium]|jgi:predicted PurR-regulated permease PerM